MIDPNTLLRNWLLSDATIAGLVGDRIYWPSLDENYKADRDGCAITIGVRGGHSDAETPIANPSMQIECWAAKGEHVKAFAVYSAVFDLIHQQNGVDRGADGVVLSCLEEVPGQPTNDPITGWATVLGFYRLMIHAA